MVHEKSPREEEVKNVCSHDGVAFSVSRFRTEKTRRMRDEWVWTSSSVGPPQVLPLCHLSYHYFPSERSLYNREATIQSGGCVAQELALVWGSNIISGIAVVIDVVALGLPSSASLVSARWSSMIAGVGLRPALFGGSPAGVFVRVRGKFNTAPVGIYHHTTFWQETNSLGSGASRFGAWRGIAGACFGLGSWRGRWCSG